MTVVGDLGQARIRAVRPVWTGVAHVSQVVACDGRVLFHAGPPFAGPEEVPPPVMNSLVAATRFEGWATTEAEAQALILAGRVRLQSAQDHDLLVPLAGVLSPSMTVVTVADAANPARRKHCALNEGNQHATRLGRADPGLTAHHRWLNGPFTEWLTTRLTEPVDLFPILRAALAAGDDCHARTLAGSAAIVELLLDPARAGTPAPAAAQTFLNSAGAFALSLWMATAALCLAAAEGTAGSQIVTRAGGNGRRFGWQSAGKPGVWNLATAPVPQGSVEPSATGSHAIGALGDSAVVDFFGLGGQALAGAPALRDALAAHLPPDWRDRGMACLGPAHAGAGLAACATDAAACTAVGKGPIILIGMIDAAGRMGRIGGGVIDVPAAVFGIGAP